LLGWRLNRELKQRNEGMLALAQIVETAGDAVIAARLDRTITTWNAGAERLFGYTAEEMIGASVSLLAVPGQEHSTQEHLEHMLEKDGMHTYEVERMHKRGELVDVAITLSPLRDDDGRIVGVSSILRDVSERKKLEADRERLLARERNARADAEYARALVEEQNGRLLELDRLKDEFVASVSHELRTPLTSISGYLDLVLEAGRLSEEQERFLGVVSRNAERLLRLVCDLLFVAQLKSSTVVLERAPVDLTELLDSALQCVAPVARDRGIDLTLDCEALPSLEGDAGRLGQMIDNLLTNALKFTPRGGSVQVRGFERDDIVCLEVRDTGMGISAEDQEHLFERFFRTSEAQSEAIQGTGLGLSIVVAIVEAHGGSVEVESELGVGTTFRVVLPTARAERDDSDRRPTGRAEVARDPARGLDHRGAELPVAAAAQDALARADDADRADGFGAAVEDRRGNAALA
jgi:PAS domain S-box-containing protein